MVAITRKLERFFGFRLRYFIEGGAWLAIGKIAATAASFILSVAYAHYLSKDLYGNYRYILSILGISGILALPGIATAITRGVARGYDGTFRRGGRIIFLSSFGITLSGLGAATFFFSNGNLLLALGFMIAAIGMPFVEGLGNWRAYLDGKKEFKYKTLLNLYQQLFSVVVTVVAIVAIVFFQIETMGSIALLFIAYSLGRGLSNIIISRQTLKDVSQSAPVEPGSLRYGLHLSALNIPSTIANYLDSVLLYTLLGPATLAVYSFAIAIPEQIKAFLSIPGDLVFPRLSEKKMTIDFKKNLVKVAVKFIAPSTLIIATYILLAPYIYSIFFPHYLEAVTFSRVFALVLIFFPFTIFNTALKAEGDIKKIYIYNLAAPIAQIILIVALIPPLGLWGAIIARIGGKLFFPFILFITKKSQSII